LPLSSCVITSSSACLSVEAFARRPFMRSRHAPASETTNSKSHAYELASGIDKVDGWPPVANSDSHPPALMLANEDFRGVA